MNREDGLRLPWSTDASAPGVHHGADIDEVVIHPFSGAAAVAGSDAFPREDSGRTLAARLPRSASSTRGEVAASADVYTVTLATEVDRGHYFKKNPNKPTRATKFLGANETNGEAVATVEDEAALDDQVAAAAVLDECNVERGVRGGLFVKYRDLRLRNRLFRDQIQTPVSNQVVSSDPNSPRDRDVSSYFSQPSRDIWRQIPYGATPPRSGILAGTHERCAWRQAFLLQNGYTPRVGDLTDEGWTDILHKRRRLNHHCEKLQAGMSEGWKDWLDDTTEDLQELTFIEYLQELANAAKSQENHTVRSVSTQTN